MMTIVNSCSEKCGVRVKFDACILTVTTIKMNDFNLNIIKDQRKAQSIIIGTYEKTSSFKEIKYSKTLLNYVRAWILLKLSLKGHCIQFYLIIVCNITIVYNFKSNIF